MRTTTRRRDDRGRRGGRIGPGPRQPVRRRGPVGSRPAYLPARGGRGGGFPLWLGILLLLILGVVLWLFLKGDAFDDGTEAPSTGPANPASAGRLTVGDDDLFAVVNEGSDALTDHEGDTVTAEGVPVESVVNDQVFWVGTGGDERVLVIVNAQNGTPPPVEAGDRVSFQGLLEPAPVDFAERFGISSEEDAALLMEQVHLVETNSLQLGR